MLVFRQPLEQQVPTLSWILPTYGVILQPGTLFMTNSAATLAFALPTSFARNRNWRLRFDTSMVSMSITSMLRKPDSARFLRISHPRPPAPITSSLAVSLIAVIEGSPGMKDSSVYAPGRERKLSRYFHFALLLSAGTGSGCMTAAIERYVWGVVRRRIAGLQM